MADQNKDLPKVQELINRLREEGVKAAQAQADQMIKEAREKAERIVAEATPDASVAGSVAGARARKRGAAKACTRCSKA